jgi:hypothetical protein
VAKRVTAPYLEGRRAPGAWRKLKHRHVETLIVTAWEPGLGRGDELLVSRRDPDSGALRNAGRVPIRVRPSQRAALHESLAAIERPRRARGRVRLLEPVLAVDVAHHGGHDGAIRDPVLQLFRPRLLNTARGHAQQVCDSVLGTCIAGQARGPAAPSITPGGLRTRMIATRAVRCWPNPVHRGRPSPTADDHRSARLPRRSRA